MKIAVQGPGKRGDGWQALEHDLMDAFTKTCENRGHKVNSFDAIGDPNGYDLISLMGVKNRELLLKAHEAKIPYVYWDKGYNRSKKWWRMSYCAHNPTDYLWELNKPDDRRLKQHWEPKDWQINPDGHIILAGSSAKYHSLYNLPDPETYWAKIVEQLKPLTDRRIVYRPKKSYGSAKPLPGTDFSTIDTIEDEMKGAYALITHGSNACFEALREGCPAIVLGNGVTKGVSSTSITDIGYPGLPTLCSREMKLRILNGLAYFQYTIAEIEKGLFWEVLDDCERLREAV